VIVLKTAIDVEAPLRCWWLGAAGCFPTLSLRLRYKASAFKMPPITVAEVILSRLLPARGGDMPEVRTALAILAPPTTAA
jgi:hypothetical protein